MSLELLNKEKADKSSSDNPLKMLMNFQVNKPHLHQLIQNYLVMPIIEEVIENPILDQKQHLESRR